MPKINVLSEDLINKIAAGEVIERPSSVLKELLENSLDAGATRVNVDIRDSGKKLIKVADNGEGMDQGDAKLAVLRHATSKIRDQDDLFSINTLGFRGEALASIAAVSQLSIVTKQHGEVEGFNLVLEGGNIISEGPIGTDQGTTMEVRNLFFNTPARMKFMKSDAVELRHIIDVVLHYALANPRVSFKLTHEGHQLINSPSVEDMKDNIASVYGLNIARDLLEVNYDHNLVKIYGYIAKPHAARNDKNQQALFVNGRWIKNEDITKAVYEGYHSTLFVNKHPIFILNLEIDPTKVDVNVHPNKSKIKIEQRKEIMEAVKEAINTTLQKSNLIPVIDSEEQETFGPPIKIQPKSPQKYDFDPSKQEPLHVKETAAELKMAELIEKEVDAIAEEGHVVAGVLDEKEPVLTQLSTEPLFPTLKLLGQIHKTFFIAETLGGLYYIDQHAAHERVLYEQFMEQHKETEVAVQNLLQGEIMEFTPANRIALEEHKSELQRMGFTLEHFGDNTYIIKTIPLIFGRIQPKEMIYEVLGLLKDGKHKLAETKEEIVTRMACRGAVMAGDTLTNVEMGTILRDLEATKLPFTCPHGRPTLIKVTVDELERMFKRK
jgi:DNA mismatch repair protein MutL